MPTLLPAQRLGKRSWKRSGPVRVCFLIDRLSRAGTEMQLLALIRSLDRSRVLPSLCLLDGDDDESRSLEPESCPVERLGIRSLLGPATFSAIASLRRHWRRMRIDVLQTYFLDSTYLGVPLARMCGVRKVVRVRNNLGHWLTNGHRRLGRVMGRLADVTLTNSSSGKQALIDAERLHPEKLVVIENGVDLDRFPNIKPLETNGPQLRVGAVANLRPVKNIDGLIRAAARLRARFPQLRFEVAGDGEQRSELQALIEEHRLVEHFRLCGSVSDIPGFLARQDLAILCSHSEGMSNALLEYMASGRAIVATDVGANRQLIDNEIHGLIVAPKDENSLVSAIEQCIQNPEMCREMGAAARKLVEEKFSRNAMVKRFEDFYEQLVS